MRRAVSFIFASLVVLGGSNEMRLLFLMEGNVYIGLLMR